MTLIYVRLSKISSIIPLLRTRIRHFIKITKLLKSMLKNKDDKEIFPPLPSSDAIPSQPTPFKSTPPTTFSLSSLSSALPHSNTSSFSSKKSKASKARPPSPSVQWASSWDKAPPVHTWVTMEGAGGNGLNVPHYDATQSNPLYKPRPFADVLLPDSHPSRFDRKADTPFNVSYSFMLPLIIYLLKYCVD